MEFESVGSFLASRNASCYGASRVNLSAHWEVLYHPRYAGKAGIGPLMVIFLTGVPLNLYIIIGILYKRLYTQPTYLLLLNLGFIDFFFCFIPILFGIITGLQGEITFGNTDYIRCQLCKITAGYILLAFVQSFNIILLSLERLVFFVSPLHYKNSVTSRKTGFVLVFIWLLSFALTLPPLFGYGDIVFSMWCGPIFLSSVHVERSIAYLFVCAIHLATCVVLIAVSNIWIACVAVKSIKKVKRICVTPDPLQASRIMQGDKDYQRAAYKHKMSREAAKKQVRFLQIFGGLVLVDVITIVPILIIMVIIAADRVTVPLYYVVFVQVAQLSHVTLHPAIEAFIAPELRKIIGNHCPTKVRYTRVGKCMYGAYMRLSRCCRAELWTKALEKELMDIYEDRSRTRTTTTSIASPSYAPSTLDTSEQPVL